MLFSTQILSFKQCQFLLSLISILLSFFTSTFQAKGAESIVLKYGFLQDSISVSDLNKFAQTGEKSLKLNMYFKLAKQNPQKIREILNKNIQVNGVALSSMLNNPLGNILLDSVSEVITTPNEKASRQSLRGALITSAMNDNQLNLMEVMMNYPTQEVHVKADRLLEIYQQMEGIFSKIPAL